MWELAKQAGKIIDVQTIEEFIDINNELDICNEFADSEIVENINLKSIKEVKNNKFERDDKNNLVNCNSTSSNIGLHEAIDQTIKIRALGVGVHLNQLFVFTKISKRLLVKL
ncbi:hypothetical protein HZS_5133 [Henneguya salminicola]|nr:hypothetical protein HZS_5133 [Henneguya salminicola]